MSFSSDVKEELTRDLPKSKSCRIAELAALISMSGQVLAKGNDAFEIFLYTENASLARRFFYLIRKTFGLSPEVRIRTGGRKKNVNYCLVVRDYAQAYRILLECRMPLLSRIWEEDSPPEEMKISPELLRGEESRRAFVRGAFIAAGSMSDPEKSYHLEFVCLGMDMARRLQEVLGEYEIETGIVERKQYYVLYMKDGDFISETLTVMGATGSMMEFENIRIKKEMRGIINRRVNFEAANIQKAVAAAATQVADIEFLEAHMDMRTLPESLRQMATARVMYPDASLKELGDLMVPPIGKSGVNHRLRKLKELAEELRDKN